MNRDFALLDASIARAREGLRLLGEIARFVFVDGETFALLKTLRHSLQNLEKKLVSARLIAARVGPDPGTGKVVETEYARHTLYELVRANSNRVTESFRTLEEFAKIYAPAVTLDLENSRYQLYAVERALLMQTPHYWFQLYASEGFVYPLSDKVLELEEYINGGARVVQLRDKTSSKQMVFEKTKSLCKFIAHYNSQNPEKVLLIMNDYVDIAAKLPVAGLHLGQEDGRAGDARRLIGTNKIIGCSNQTSAQVAESVKAGADYVSIGPVYETPTKPDRAAVGLKGAAEALEAAEGVPLVAIGGIDNKNVHLLYSCGVNNVAVIRSAKDFFGTD